MTESTAIAAPTSVNTDPAALDEVMLAMDIVDTLRHEQSIVHRELAADVRDATLIERIKHIYAGQGIAVTDDLIAKGVEAMKQDRFLYIPPKPSFKLRLAHFYVDRRLWLRRSVIALVIGSGAYLAYQLPQQFNANRAYSRYQSEAANIAALADQVTARITAIELSLARQYWLPNLIEKPVERLRVEAASSLQQAKVLADNISAVTALERTAFDRNPATAGNSLINSANTTRAVDLLLSKAEAQTRDIDQLRTLATRAVVAITTLDSTLSTADRVTITPVRVQAEASLQAGDIKNAESPVARLEDFAAMLAQAYELRIVSRPGSQSGIWRYPVDNPQGRNYYLVVEAIGEEGMPLPLAIDNEETGKRETVSTFAVRVPESVYEEVKSDKQDNGLIDHALVGVKRRGELNIDYQVDIAGGNLTEWGD